MIFLENFEIQSIPSKKCGKYVWRFFFSFLEEIFPNQKRLTKGLSMVEDEHKLLSSFNLRHSENHTH